MAKVTISFTSETVESFELTSETIASASQVLNERLTELIQDTLMENISSEESQEDELDDDNDEA